MTTPHFPSAICATADPEAWFPRPHSWDTANDQAIALCQRCPHQQACLDYALRVRVEGIWGGTTQTGRERMRKQRGITAIPLAATLVA